VAQEGTISYDEKIVAYLDILGFRRFVLQSRAEAELAIRWLDDSVKHVLDCLPLEGGPDWFSVKLFSDCFCISCDNTDLDLMLSEVSFLQYSLAENGIFIRGGLSTGAHFENERIIFSEGLVRAYELQALDPYPRVLIDPVLVSRIQGVRSDGGENELLPFAMKGQDGAFFLDYLHYLRVADAYTGCLDENIEAHKKAVVEQVALNRGRPEVIAKYRWVADYHNLKFSEFYKSEDWVDGYFETLRDRLLIPPTTFQSRENIE